MSLFKKPTRKYRTRKAESDSDEEENKVVENVEETKPSRETKTSDLGNFDENDDENDSNSGFKHEVKMSNTLKLSFDEEEEGEMFKVKKSVYSRRMGKYHEKEREKKKREKEEIVKQEIPKPPIHVKTEPMNSSDDESKESSVRKRMEKEKELSIKWIPSQIKQEEVTEVSQNEFYLPSSEDDDDSNSTGFRSCDNLPQFRGVLEKGIIPDAKTIYALKKQRQMARDASDFISVEIETNKGRDSDDNSRLMHDGDGKSGEEDDEDEDDDRIDFTVDKEAQEKEKAREAFLQAQEEEENKDDYESEDELEKWEQEQIRKGGGANLLAATFGAQINDDSLFSSLNASEFPDDFSNFKRKGNKIPDHLLKPRKRISHNEVILKMMNEAKLMRQNIESNERYITNIDMEINMCKNNIKHLEDEIEQLIKKCDSLKTMHMKQEIN